MISKLIKKTKYFYVSPFLSYGSKCNFFINYLCSQPRCLESNQSEDRRQMPRGASTKVHDHTSWCVEHVHNYAGKCPAKLLN